MLSILSSGVATSSKSIRFCEIRDIWKSFSGFVLELVIERIHGSVSSDFREATSWEFDSDLLYPQLEEPPEKELLV